jgi:hypothetical protein
MAINLFEDVIDEEVLEQISIEQLNALNAILGKAGY